MIRKVFVLGVAFVALILGFGAFAGTALAASQTCSEAQSAVTSAQATLTTAEKAIPVDPTAVLNAKNAVRAAQNDRDRACRIGGPVGGPARGPIFQNCADYSRAGIRSIRRGDPRYNLSLDRDRDGIACDSTDTTTTTNGDCTTTTTAFNNYRSAVTKWNDRVVRDRSLLRLDNGELTILRNLQSDRDRYLGDYRRNAAAFNTHTSTTTTCTVAQPTTINQITVQAPPASYTAPASTPAPSYSAPSSGSSIPSGAVSTGGDDAGFLLLYPWGSA